MAVLRLPAAISLNFVAAVEEYHRVSFVGFVSPTLTQGVSR
jgi:hypothetical protein